MTARLDPTDAFIPRHIGPGHADQASMLAAIGAPSLDALIEQVVPANIRMTRDLDLPGPRDEADVLAEMKSIAAKK